MANRRPQLRRVDRIQRLVVFEAAARLGSFTAAATDLGMTQPAVTRQIRLLERSLGAQLFLRGPNSIALSDAGARLREHISAGFDVLEAGLAELSEAAGTFVLAVTSGLAHQVLFTRLDRLAAAIGDVDLRLMNIERSGDLTQGGFDAAIWIGTGEFPGLSSVRLFDEVVVPVASPALAADYGLHPESTAAEVQQAPLIHVDDGDRPWMTWNQWLGHFGIELQRQPPRILFDNYPLVVQQALASRGVALGWRRVIDDLVATDGLVVVGPEVRSERGYYLVWPAGEPNEPVQATIDWLGEVLGPEGRAPDERTAPFSPDPGA